jgi:hypothetical protein
MKKITLPLFFVALIGIGTLLSHTSFAIKPEPTKSSNTQQLNKIIKESVKYPDFKMTKEEKGDITITFSLTDDGKVKVEKIIAGSQRLEDYVKKQLSDVIAKDVIHSYNQLYKVKFRFENS